MEKHNLIDIIKFNYFANQCELKFLIKQDILKFIAWKPKDGKRWYLIDYYKNINGYEIGMIGYGHKSSDFEIIKTNTPSVYYSQVFREFTIAVINNFFKFIVPDENDDTYIFSDDDYDKAYKKWIEDNGFIVI